MIRPRAAGASGRRARLPHTGDRGMAGTRSDIEGWLTAGITAARQGQRAQAVELLLKVVEADQHIEAAWLWLSHVVDDPHDRLIALENALTVNPASQAAQRGLAHLRAEHPALFAGPAEPPAEPSLLEESPAERSPAEQSPAEELPAEEFPAEEPLETPAAAPDDDPFARLRQRAAQAAELADAPAAASGTAGGGRARWGRRAAPAAVAAAAPAAVAPLALPGAAAAEPEAVVDEALRCVYCGRPTRETDTRCPACRKSLMITARQYEDRSSNLNWLVIILGALAARGLLDLGGPMIALTLRGPDPGGNNWFTLPLPGAHGGDPLVTALWLGVAWVVGRSLIYAILAIGLHARIAAFYYAVIGYTLLNLVLALFELGQVLISGRGMDSPVSLLLTGAGLLGVLLNLVALYFIAGAWGDFQVKRQRMLSRLDRDARDPQECFRRGQLYRRHNMWGLAAAHYGRAYEGVPDSAEFGRNYAVALSQIGLDTKALQLLRRLQDRHPGDLHVPQMIALLDQKVARRQGRARSK
jgi:tetratricopeptide (TPR) repeat protein